MSTSSRSTSASSNSRGPSNTGVFTLSCAPCPMGDSTRRKATSQLVGGTLPGSPYAAALSVARLAAPSPRGSCAPDSRRQPLPGMTICPSSHSSRRLADARVTRVAAGANPAAKGTDDHFITMPGSRQGADATRALFLGHQRPAPTELVAQPLVEGFRRAEPNDLEPLRVGSASDDIADRHLMSAGLAVNAHLSGPTHHAQTDVLTWSEHDRTHGQRERAHG